MESSAPQPPPSSIGSLSKQEPSIGWELSDKHSSTPLLKYSQKVIQPLDCFRLLSSAVRYGGAKTDTNIFVKGKVTPQESRIQHLLNASYSLLSPPVVRFLPKLILEIHDTQPLWILIKRLTCCTEGFGGWTSCQT